MSTITFNGVNLELDLLDADVMERYESLNKEVAETVQEPTQYEGLSTAEGMRLQCRILDDFFDRLFGEGTAQKLFEGNNNLGDRMDAFGRVSEMNADIDRRMNQITSKYGVERLQNRDQRRSQKQRYRNNSRKGAHR